MKPNLFKIVAARIALTVIAVAIIGGAWAGGKAGWNALTKPAPEEEVAAHPADTEEAITVSSELADRIALHKTLPERSPLGLGVFGESQASNSQSMEALLGTLTEEIGSTPAAATVKILRENREKERMLEGLQLSDNPELAERAKGELEKLRVENTELVALVQKTLNREGFDFTEAQIGALCASPNAEDTTSMISAFACLKTISSEMERRLRTSPCQEMAQRYYGAHCVLLIALDKIQKRTMENIVDKHIPKAIAIREETLTTRKEAEGLLKESGLSSEEAKAMEYNIASCIKTEEITKRTEEKLRKNLEIIGSANKKLVKSIAAAKNCHMTALLQKEILQLETSHLSEIARIEALTIPELVAVSFADPDHPIVSPPRVPRM